MLSIFLDITSCSREYSYSNSFQIEGQLVDIITRRPVKHLELRMETADGSHHFQTVADESGKFQVTVSTQANPDYSLYVQDKRYKIVNANHHVNRYAGKQVWYLLPVGSNQEPIYAANGIPQ